MTLISARTNSSRNIFLCELLPIKNPSDISGYALPMYSQVQLGIAGGFCTRKLTRRAFAVALFLLGTYKCI